MYRYLLCIVSLVLLTSSIAVAQEAEVEDAPTTAPTPASSLMVGHWSLDMAAGVAASESVAEEDRARLIENMADINMMMLITEDGRYETSMVMGGETYQRPGSWTIEAETDAVVRLAFVHDSETPDAAAPPSYMTLTFDSPDSGTCLIESEGYPVPMQRVTE